MTDILFEYDHMLIRSEYRTPDIHSHLAVHLVIAIDGKLNVVVGDDSLETEAVFIASDVNHTIYADKGEMLVYLFDSTTWYAAEIQTKYLKVNSYFTLPSDTAKELQNIWKNCKGNLKAADSKLLSFLELTKIEDDNVDVRIKTILETMKEISEIPSDFISLLCDKVNLSKSRLSHLFKESMGISMHRYIALDKMKKGFLYYMQYQNITDAAMQAGFDSPSHFASTCKRMFGLSFSEFIKS